MAPMVCSTVIKAVVLVALRWPGEIAVSTMAAAVSSSGGPVLRLLYQRLPRLDRVGELSHVQRHGSNLLTRAPDVYPRVKSLAATRYAPPPLLFESCSVCFYYTSWPVTVGEVGTWAGKPAKTGA